jgi:hypothetical protein
MEHSNNITFMGFNQRLSRDNAELILPMSPKTTDVNIPFTAFQDTHVITAYTSIGSPIN